VSSRADSAAGNGRSARLRVGDVARLTGKSVRAIHLYEELGLLRPVERSPGGYRLFGPDAVERVAWISKLQAMGFSLAKVREFVRSLEQTPQAPLAMLRVQAMLRQKLEETRGQIEKLRALEADLEDGLAYLEQCSTCTRIEESEDCSECVRHRGTPPPIIETGMTKSERVP